MTEEFDSIDKTGYKDATDNTTSKVEQYSLNMFKILIDDLK